MSERKNRIDSSIVWPPRLLSDEEVKEMMKRPDYILDATKLK